MPGWFAEFLYVLAVSKRTQWALIFGVSFYIVVSLLGDYMSSNLSFHEPFKFLEDIVTHKILRKYDKVALWGMLSFFGLAIKSYLKDRKRLW